MRRVAVVACDHGLGHVRRSVLVARELRARGADVTLLAPRAKVERVERALAPDLTTSSDAPPSGASGTGAIALLDLATGTTPEALRAGLPGATCWVERLPDLDAFDVVVTDTLPEVLEVRPDAVLVAQFWWHDVLDDVDPGYREHVMALLAAHRGPVLGTVPFAMPAVTDLPGFVGVGLFSSAGGGSDRGMGAAPPEADRDVLLITGGSTAAVDGLLRPLVVDLRDPGPGPFREVAVDPRLLPEERPEWLVPASFTAAALDRVAAALVRPGLGIVTELLERHVPMLCVREPGNRELEHNVGAVEALGAGRDAGELTSERGERSAAGILARLDRAPIDGRGHGPSDRPRLDGASSVAEVVLGSA